MSGAGEVGTRVPFYFIFHTNNESIFHYYCFRIMVCCQNLLCFFINTSIRRRHDHDDYQPLKIIC